MTTKIKVYINEKLEYSTNIPTHAFIYSTLRGYYNCPKERVKEIHDLIWKIYLRNLKINLEFAIAYIYKHYNELKHLPYDLIIHKINTYYLYNEGGVECV